jgi:hypothetical protein
MKRLAPALLLAAALAFGSCATKTPAPVDYVVDGVVECAKAGVHEVAVSIIDDAASALATGDWQSALLNMVKRFGEGAVACAVAEVADTAGKHAALNELEALKAKRAREWLASRPVKVSTLMHRGAEEARWVHIPEVGGSIPPGATPILAGLCPHPGCIDEESGGDRWDFRWALPFEDVTPLVTLSASRQPGECVRGMHPHIMPPYPLAKVCVTDDYTFDVDIRYPREPRAETYLIDGPPQTSITVPIGHGRFNTLPVDGATRMTGAMPIGLTDYNDVQCANFEVNRFTGVILSERRWYCESI